MTLPHFSISPSICSANYSGVLATTSRTACHPFGRGDRRSLPLGVPARQDRGRSAKRRTRPCRCSIPIANMLVTNHSFRMASLHAIVLPPSTPIPAPKTTAYVAEIASLAAANTALKAANASKFKCKIGARMSVRFRSGWCARRPVGRAAPAAASARRPRNDGAAPISFFRRIPDRGERWSGERWSSGGRRERWSGRRRRAASTTLVAHTRARGARRHGELGHQTRPA